MGNSLCNVALFFLWYYILLTVGFSIYSGSSEVLCIPSEREALLMFKHHLKDSSNRLHSWDHMQDCCHWKGVVCSNLTGHVLELHLRTSPSLFDDYSGFHDEQLKAMFGGEISPSLLGLKHITYLDLSGNDFGGIQIPSFIGSMKSLTHLNLSKAHFGGMIPYQIGNLSNLLYLNLHGNDLYARSLQWLLHLSSLQYLDFTYLNLFEAHDWLQILKTLPSLMELYMSDCNLNLNILPSTIVNFSSLVVLDLSYNYYQQPSLIPRWIFGLQKLVSLNLSYNHLQGPIPDGIQNLTRLQNFDLSINEFNSTIPMWLYRFTDLKFLNLQLNNLCGTISNAIGNLTSLVRLHLSDNQFEGKIPRSLGNLCNMREFYFSNLKANQETSEILDIFSTCSSPKLEIFSLTDSKLYGHLTDQIGTFKNLVELYLYNNSIQGGLPKSLGKLPSLKYLVLERNQFIGNPFEVLGSSSLVGLFLGDNLFQGVVTEDHLANFTMLKYLHAGTNQLTLKVSPKWSPSFKLQGLDLRSWQLGPSFPSWIQSQKHLRFLLISNTNISDSIPISFWSSLKHCFELDLSHNQIYGQLPNSSEHPLTFKEVDLSSNRLSGQLPYLSQSVLYLDLSNNLFSGAITDFLCQQQHQQSSIEYLNLASNNLSEKIPECWRGWEFLMVLSLANNYLIGTIPTSLAYLRSLEVLILRGNELSGKLPNSLRNCIYLFSLDLGENKLSETIPTWIGERPFRLSFLSLQSNRFIGQIPSSICALKFLQVLDISQNYLSGHIPKCLHRLSLMSGVINMVGPSFSLGFNGLSYMVSSFVMMKGKLDEYNKTALLLIVIDLSNNKLSGEIPREITSLRELLFLNLSYNALIGQIPENIGNMRSLLSIDFSRNQLYGEIPQSITNLSFLNNLNLSFNNLKGEVPRGTQLQSFEASSFIGNDLCGPPLPIKCAPVDSTHDMDQIDKADEHRIHWFYVSMALGFIVGFWGVVGPLFFSRSWRFAYYRFFDGMWYKLQDYCVQVIDRS